MKKQIYYHDTDAGGVVYYGNYLKYLEESRTEVFEQKGLSVQKLSEEGFLYAVRKCNLDYKSPARYGDIINCTAAISKITAAQIFFDQEITLEKDGRLLVKAEIILVSLSQDFKPKSIPDNVKESLSK